MIIAKEETGGFAALMDSRAWMLSGLTRHIEAMRAEAGGMLADTAAYALSVPGKLLRPLLLLDACRAAGGDPDMVFPAAAGTEYGHVASLIHDDIIDGGDERRGQPTLHVKHDVATAILTGDFLIFETFLSYTQCYDRGASAQAVLRAIRVLSKTCVDVCRGQALEAQVCGDVNISERDYLDIIDLKTASVCRASTTIGACLAEADEPMIEALGAYGHDIGMAFQILDDVLAYEGRSTIVGKPLDNDLHNRRVTLPVIYALSKADRDARAAIEALFGDAADRPANGYDDLATALESTGALDRAHAKARGFTEQAKRELDRLPPSDSRERLRYLADVFMTRDH